MARWSCRVSDTIGVPSHQNGMSSELGGSGRKPEASRDGEPVLLERSKDELTLVDEFASGRNLLDAWLRAGQRVDARAGGDAAELRATRRRGTRRAT